MVSILDFATSVVATYPVETAPDRAVCGLGRKLVHACGREKEGRVQVLATSRGGKQGAGPVQVTGPRKEDLPEVDLLSSGAASERSAGSDWLARASTYQP